MADIVNLRMVRKRKARLEKERAAEESRLHHGRSKAERDATSTAREREASAHEGHRRERADDEE